MLSRNILFILILVIGFPAEAATYKIRDDLIGKIISYEVKPKDTLYDIARRHDIGIVELLAANPGVDPWVPKPETTLTLPTSHVLPIVRKGIVINLAELRLFYFLDENRVMTFPIGVGREGWQTPIGNTVIAKKRKDPDWIPPESIREENPDLPDIVPSGPDNPLGKYALSLGWDKFLIHGTNRPFSVGKRSSHGCIRLYPEDVAILFDAVNEGAEVTIIDAPYKLGWKGDTLFLEVTPTQQQSDEIANYQMPTPLSSPEIHNAVKIAVAGADHINWEAVDTAISGRSGIPTVIATRK